MRRRALAAELNERYTDKADTPSPDELNFLRSEGFMLPMRRTDPDESTYTVPDKGLDEVVSGWSINPTVCMPGTVRTRNERLVVDPLSASELRQRDRAAVYCVGKDDAALTKKVVKGSASPLGTAAAVVFKLQPARLPCGQVCGVPGCTSVCGQRALRGGSALILCDVHLAGQCVGGSLAGTAWSADGRCVGCWSEVAAADSWLLSSGHRTCTGI